MTISGWLTENIVKLGDAKVDSPRRDALVLLEDTLNKDRAWVLAHPEYDLGQRELERVGALIKRRINREPLAYIRGKAWFYGRFFEVNPDVLIPRPESEDFIDILKELENGKWKMEKIVDIGTGSGALAITTKLELTEATVFATDIDKQALKIAQNNAKRHKVSVKFLKGSLLKPLQNLELDSYVIVANLPYVPEHLITSPEIEQEPSVALFSGKYGLGHYREFWKQVSDLKSKPKYILTESLETQHDDLEKMANLANYSLIKTNTLVQAFKLI